MHYAEFAEDEVRFTVLRLLPRLAGQPTDLSGYRARLC